MSSTRENTFAAVAAAAFLGLLAGESALTGESGSPSATAVDAAAARAGAMAPNDAPAPDPGMARDRAMPSMYAASPACGLSSAHAIAPATLVDGEPSCRF